MRRWAAAVIAILFLATAGLHVYSHVGGADFDCSVCQVHQAGAVAAPVPVIAASPVAECLLAALPAPHAAAVLVSRAAARAPPALPV